jgi:DNA-binding FrmR family transcriptional regulator
MSEVKGADHRAQVSRVNKVEGQIRGIKKMIEDEQYCVQILTQIKAARSALKSLELIVLEKHLNHCVKDIIHSGKKADVDSKMTEIMELLKKTSKS